MHPKKLSIPSFRPTVYQDFFTPENAALDIAAAVTGSASLLSRNIWRKRLEILGEEVFRNELFLFWSDLRAGEEVRRRERVFTARLKVSRYSIIRAMNRLLKLAGSDTLQRMQTSLIDRQIPCKKLHAHRKHPYRHSVSLGLFMYRTRSAFATSSRTAGKRSD